MCPLRSLHELPIALLLASPQAALPALEGGLGPPGGRGAPGVVVLTSAEAKALGQGLEPGPWQGLWQGLCRAFHDRCSVDFLNMARCHTIRLKFQNLFDVVIRNYVFQRPSDQQLCINFDWTLQNSFWCDSWYDNVRHSAQPFVRLSVRLSVLVSTRGSVVFLRFRTSVCITVGSLFSNIAT